MTLYLIRALWTFFLIHWLGKHKRTLGCRSEMGSGRIKAPVRCRWRRYEAVKLVCRWTRRRYLQWADQVIVMILLFLGSGKSSCKYWTGREWKGRAGAVGQMIYIKFAYSLGLCMACQSAHHAEFMLSVQANQTAKAKSIGSLELLQLQSSTGRLPYKGSVAARTLRHRSPANLLAVSRNSPRMICT